MNTEQAYSIDNLIILLITSILSCTAYYFWAKKKQIVDNPNERSSHTHTPVRGMGVALLPPLLVVAIFFQVWHMGTFIFGLILAMLVGYLDDRLDLRVYIRLPLYFIALMATVYVSPYNDALESINPFWIVWCCVMVFGLGLMNAYNFMDGINGITGIYSIVFLGSSLYITRNYQSYIDAGDPVTALILAVLVYLLVFGFFNYRHKALAFLGDSGSVLLGLFVTAILFRLFDTTGGFNPILLLAVYGVDSILTIILRIARKENIFKAHRSHLYQDLVHVKGWSHLKVSLIYGGVQLIINYLCFAERHFVATKPQMIIGVIALLICIYLWAKYRMNQLNIRRVPND